MTTEQIFLIAGLFFVVAILYSSVGHAGSSGYQAVMGLVGMAPFVMKPTALVLNISVAIIASAQFWRAGHFSWKLFWPFAAASIPLAFLGGKIALPPQYYRFAVGAVLLFSAWRMAAQSLRKDEMPVREPRLGASLAAGGVLGFVAGLTGTGGGIFLSPLILLCRWADPKKTAAVSAMFILVNSVSGIAGWMSDSKQTLPRAEWSAALPAWIGAVVVGGLIGSYLGSRKLGTQAIRRMLAVVLLIAGGKLIHDGAIGAWGAKKGPPGGGRAIDRGRGAELVVVVEGPAACGGLTALAPRS
jgi:uncharacterized membrane protein YfcA